MQRETTPAPLGHRILRAAGISAVLALALGLVPLRLPAPDVMGLPTETMLKGLLAGTAFCAALRPLPRGVLASALGLLGIALVLDGGTAAQSLSAEALLLAGVEAFVPLLAVFAMGIGDPVPEERRGRAPVPRDASPQRRLLGGTAAVHGRRKVVKAPGVKPRRVKLGAVAGTARPQPVAPLAKSRPARSERHVTLGPHPTLRRVRMVDGTAQLQDVPSGRVPEVLPKADAPVLLLTKAMQDALPNPLSHQDDARQVSSA